MKEKTLMEMTVFITPAITLAGVWLGARYTLRNEIMKKSLEIRTSRIETLAAECDECLAGLADYVGAVASCLDSELTVVRTLKRLTGGSIAVSELNTLTTMFDSGPWKPEADRLRRCRQNLAFHRPDDLRLWSETVVNTRKRINDFLMITQPGEPVRDMRGIDRSEEEIRAFIRQLQQAVRDIDAFREALSSDLAQEFRQLTTTGGTFNRLQRLFPSARRRQ